jgi:membrane protein implicated in regulation of membrane protease activity
VKYFLIYTGLRIALFLATWAVVLGIAVAIFGTGTQVGLWSFVAAVVISSALSLKVLAGPRERFARSVEERAARAAARFEEIKTREDAE